jgi:hypothetical protein
MNYISSTHQRLSCYLNNNDVLNNPEKYLGPNYKILLNFWIHTENINYIDNNNFDYDIFKFSYQVVHADIRNFCNNTSLEIITAHLIQE